MSDKDKGSGHLIATRQEALAAGDQVCLSEKFPDPKFFKYPVYCTKKVWELIDTAVNNEDWLNDYKGVLWDIYNMSHMLGRPIFAGTGVEFEVIVQGSAIEPNADASQSLYRLWRVHGPMDVDDPSHVITFKFPEEI